MIKNLEFTIMASYAQFSCHSVTPPRLLMAANTSPGIRNRIQQLIQYNMSKAYYIY